MDIEYIIRRLGEDIDLLTMSDDWLEEHRISLSSELDNIEKQLQAVKNAQEIKIKLQQTNLVALKKFIKNDKGETINIEIGITSLNNAIQYIKKLPNKSDLDKARMHAQVLGWLADGYDIENANQLM